MPLTHEQVDEVFASFHDRKANGGDDESGRRRERFKPTAIDDIVLGEDAIFLVDGIWPRGPSLNVVVGKDKSGKTFLMMDALFHVAMGRPYLGRTVEQGAVVYVTSEGIRGVERRLIALRRHYGVEGQRVPFYLVRDMVDLGDRRDVDALIARLRADIAEPIAAIGLDPLIRAMPGKSDNEGADMNVVADNCEVIGRAFAAAVVLGHHTPRGDETRSRGSNVLDGDADSMLSVVKSDGVSTVTVYRMKDGREGLTWKFRLEPVEIGQDHKGATLTSCVCASITVPTYDDEGASSASKRKRLLSAGQTRFLDIVTKAVDEAGQPVAGAPNGARAVTRDMLKRYCITNGYIEAEVKPNAIRGRISSMLNTLAGKNIIGVSAEHIWLAQAAQASASISLFSPGTASASSASTPL